MNIRKKLNMKNSIIILVLLIIMIQIIKNPKQSISSAKVGLDLWFNLLLPSLFPFIFISDLLISLGFVSFFSKFLEPVMRPVFNVSGIGIFPFSMSIMSGYPVGARLTSKLREINQISNTEGNRLISFSSTSGPLFILGTVLIGMLGFPKLAGIMIIPHYLGAITIGLLFRFYRKSEKSSNNNILDRKNELFNNQEKNKSIGSLISKSIKDSMDSIIVIGGFIIIYSVIIDLLLLSSSFNFFIGIISNITSTDANTLKGITAGIIELTKGCNLVSKLDIALINKIMIINFLIGWGGFSIHSQAISFISSTDISTKIYFFSKALHGLIATIYTYLMYIMFYKGQLTTTFYNSISIVENPNIKNWLFLVTSSTKIALSLIIFLFLISIFVNELSKPA